MNDEEKLHVKKAIASQIGQGVGCWIIILWAIVIVMRLMDLISGETLLWLWGIIFIVFAIGGRLLTSVEIDRIDQRKDD